MSESLTYASVGVDYGTLDAFKRLAQAEAAKTASNLPPGWREVAWTRGESCFLLEPPAPADFYVAHVDEGLGTKNLVADHACQHAIIERVARLTGRTYYDSIAQDTVAMIVNDMATLGAQPLSVAMHLAVGEVVWFRDEARAHDLTSGWSRACLMAGCSWALGETSVLGGLVVPVTAVLKGSAVGVVMPKSSVIAPRIAAGDSIVLLASSGIHANGLTLARLIVERLPRGYTTLLPDGHTVGEDLLEPTVIYVPVVRACQAEGIDIHYAVHITGHGWRKLMRAVEPFVYVIDDIGDTPLIFRFLQYNGRVSDEEAYATFNMGAGFALYVPPDQVRRVIDIAAGQQVKAWLAGHVEKRGDEKKVVIVPKGIKYTAETLALR